MLILEVYPFQDQRLWLTTAMMLLAETHLVISQETITEEERRWLLISSSLPSAPRGVSGLDWAPKGREMASSFTGPGWGWPELPPTRKPPVTVHGAVSGSALVFTSEFYLWFWCQWQWQWLISVCVQTRLFGTTALICIFYCWVSFLNAFEGMLREDKWKQRHNSNKNSSYMIELRLQLW